MKQERDLKPQTEASEDLVTFFRHYDKVHDVVRMAMGINCKTDKLGY